MKAQSSRMTVQADIRSSAMQAQLPGTRRKTGGCHFLLQCHEFIGKCLQEIEVKNLRLLRVAQRRLFSVFMVNYSGQGNLHD